MYTHIYIHINMYTHIYIYTYITEKYVYIHTYIHINIYIPAITRPPMLGLTANRIKPVLTYTYTYIHIHVHTYIHTYIIDKATNMYMDVLPAITRPPILGLTANRIKPVLTYTYTYIHKL
jgi:hypothetical protein